MSNLIEQFCRLALPSWSTGEIICLINFFQRVKKSPWTCFRLNMEWASCGSVLASLALSGEKGSFCCRGRQAFELMPESWVSLSWNFGTVSEANKAQKNVMAMHCWNYNILVGQHLCPWPCGNAQNCTPWFIYFILFCYFYFVVFFFFLQWNGTWDFQSNRRFPHSASAARICFLLWLAHLIVSVNLVRRTFHYWFAFICIFIVVVLFCFRRIG